MDDQNLKQASTKITYNLVEFKSIYKIVNYHISFIKRSITHFCKFRVLIPKTKNNIFFSLMVRATYGDLSVVLSLDSELDDVMIKFYFSLLNKDNKRIWTTETYSKFLNLNDRVSPTIKLVSADTAYGYLFDNNLRISVEGTVYVKIPPTTTVNVSKKHIVEDFKNLFNTEELYDVTFSVGNTKIKAHKVILAARSPVFKAMFSHETIENSKNQVEIIDIQPEVLKDLLYFIYTGEAHILNTNADELLAAADKYELLDLKSKCENALRKHITSKNVYQNIVLADLHNARKLKEDAISFIKQHGTEMMETPEWKYMTTEYPKLVTDILLSYF